MAGGVGCGLVGWLNLTSVFHQGLSLRSGWVHAIGQIPGNEWIILVLFLATLAKCKLRKPHLSRLSPVREDEAHLFLPKPQNTADGERNHRSPPCPPIGFTASRGIGKSEANLRLIPDGRWTAALDRKQNNSLSNWQGSQSFQE